MRLHNQTLIPEQFEIPSLPQIYLQIREVIENPTSSFEEIGSIIKKDSGLSANLLRVANSVMYGSPKRIDSITRAVVRLGTKDINAIALSTTAISLFKGIPKDLINMQEFWKHSIACAVAAKSIATYLNIGNTERFFLGGMLHDVGKLILFKNMPDLSKQLLTHCRTQNKMYYAVEKEMLGLDHTDIAGTLLQKWNIPESIVQMIVYHHRPEDAKTSLNEVSIIHIADIFINGLQYGSSGTYFVPTLYPKAWESTGLRPAMIPTIVKHFEIQIDDVVKSIFLNT